jgi:hypothetical protein
LTTSDPICYKKPQIRIPASPNGRHRAAVAVFRGEAMQHPADTGERDEHARVDAWRLEVLLEAGYQPHRAELLAARHDVDLHEAISLLKAGCPQRTALQILL